MTHRGHTGVSERRQRGVPLKTLDRTKVYRIWHTGRRWEVLGAEGEPEASRGTPDGRTGAVAGGVSTVRHPGEREYPDASRTEGA